MPNLLINGDFQINQRGQESYTAGLNPTYGFDIWQQYNSTAKKT